MNKYRLYIKIVLPIFLLSLSATLLAQSEEFVYNDLDKCDPFVPLIDERGNFRENCKKPPEEVTIPKISLMGISKVGGVFYALIDGELVKEGQVFKEIKIKKIDADKVVASFKDQVFELKLDRGKK